jgi:hypothetical protein
MPDDVHPIAIIQKNSFEEVVLSLTVYCGHDLVDLRTHARFRGDTGDGGKRPTRKGVSLKIALLPKLIAGLQKVQAEAERRGLLQVREERP